MGFLVDTCAWIDVERGALAPADVESLTQSEPIFMSPVTLAELRFGADAAQDPGVRQRRLAALRRLARKPLLAIDGATGEIFGSLAAQIKAAGSTASLPRSGSVAGQPSRTTWLPAVNQKRPRLRGHSRPRPGALPTASAQTVSGRASARAKLPYDPEPLS